MRYVSCVIAFLKCLLGIIILAAAILPFSVFFKIGIVFWYFIMPFVLFAWISTWKFPRR